jgi:hypothetical protein
LFGVAVRLICIAIAHSFIMMFQTALGCITLNGSPAPEL